MRFGNTGFFFSGSLKMLGCLCRGRGGKRNLEGIWKGVGKMKRRYASVGRVFDREAKMKQKTRNALLEDGDDNEYLKEEINKRLLDRLEDVYAHQFETVLEIGSGRGNSTLSLLLDRDDVKTIVQLDSSYRLLSSDYQSRLLDSHGTFQDLKTPIIVFHTIFTISPSSFLIQSPPAHIHFYPAFNSIPLRPHTLSRDNQNTF